MKKTIPVINGLRGIAIIAIQCTHFFRTFVDPKAHHFTFAGIKIFPLTLLSNTGEAVTLFFILSGIVLALPYADKSRSMMSFSDVFYFYKRRVTRLFPLLIGSIVISILLHTGLDVHQFIDALGKILWATFWPFPTILSDYYPQYNFVLWSLRVEIWFSILFPVILCAIYRFNIVKISLGILIINILLRTADVLHIFDAGEYFRNSFIGRIDAFVFGVCLAFFLQKKRHHLDSRWALFLGLMLVIISFWLRDLGEIMSLPLQYPIRRTIISIGLTMITASLIYNYNSLAAKIVSSPFLQIPGIMCYSIYIWHGIFFKIFTPYWQPTHAARILFMTGFFSIISYIVLERGSFHRLRDTFHQKPSEFPTNTTSSSTI